MNRKFSIKRLCLVALFAVTLCATGPCMYPQFVESYAGHTHTFLPNTTKTVQQTSVTSIKAIGSPVYGGWEARDSQKVQFGGSATKIRGKSYSVTKTASVTLTGSLSAELKGALTGQVEAKAGVTKEWKKQKYNAIATNSARNKTNKNRWIIFCTRNKYQIYEITYKVSTFTYKPCSTCHKVLKSVKNISTRKGYIAKKVGVDSAYFYSDSGSAFKKTIATTFKKTVNGVSVKYETGKKYLTKNGKAISGDPTKKDQNFNTFSNIKYWK